jgi:hypothetical protein
LDAYRCHVIWGGATVDVWTREKLATDELTGVRHICLRHPEPPGNRGGSATRQCLKMIGYDRPDTRIRDTLNCAAIDLEQQAIPQVAGAYSEWACLTQDRDHSFGLGDVRACHMS